MTKSELAEVLRAVADLDPDFLVSAAWRGDECRLYFATYPQTEGGYDMGFRTKLRDTLRKLGFRYGLDEVQRAYYVDLLEPQDTEMMLRERD